jgi:hypothetical protein
VKLEEAAELGPQGAGAAPAAAGGEAAGGMNAKPVLTAAAAGCCCACACAPEPSPEKRPPRPSEEEAEEAEEGKEEAALAELLLTWKAKPPLRAVAEPLLLLLPSCRSRPSPPASRLESTLSRALTPAWLAMGPAAGLCSAAAKPAAPGKPPACAAAPLLPPPPPPPAAAARVMRCACSLESSAW